MKAVFLDRKTFSNEVNLPAPNGITEWVVYDETPHDPKIIAERLKGAQIAITNKVPLGETVLSACPDLKFIQVTATGTNNIDQSACEKYGVKMKNVAGYSTKSVVEHTFMLMLSAMRGLLPYHQRVANGDYQAQAQFCLVDLPLLDLNGKTLVIVGSGNIGQGMKKVAEAFEMKVFFAERKGQKPRSSEYLPFEEAFAVADVISLHCPLTPDTQFLINEETLTYCQKKPLLINGARGPVVKSEAVVEALNRGLLSGFATDVFIQEPPPADEALLTLKNHPRVLFTPHNAWASVQAQEKLWAILSVQVSDFIQNQQ